MKKRILSVLLAGLLALSLWACKSETPNTSGDAKTLITQDEAIQAALDHAGYSKADVTGIHVHMGQADGTTIYSIHFTGGDQSYSIVVDAFSGQILELDDPHGH